VKHIPAKLHSDLIWNEGALGLLRTSCLLQQQQEQDDYGYIYVRSVPDLDMYIILSLRGMEILWLNRLTVLFSQVNNTICPSDSVGGLKE